MRLLAVICGCVLSLPGAAATKRVAVMYFDNNTAKEEYDPLRKGLADMLISDLAGAPGLTIVEREKLQKLVEELDLQKTRFFDPATALKMGKGLGATHAISGSIAAIDPQLRLDIRLIEIATGKVLVTEHVKGSKDRFFELEEELVKKFLVALQEADGPRTTSGAQDLASMVAYGKAIEAADKGDFKAASSAMSKVVSAAPAFSLAKDRYQQILKKLYGAAAKREDVLATAEQQLQKNADAFLVGKDVASLTGRDDSHYFGYRILKGSLLMRQLAALLKNENVPSWSNPKMSAAQRATALPLMRAWYDNAEILNAEVRRWKEGVGKRAGFVPTELPQEDEQRLRSLVGSSDDAIACFGCPAQLPIDIAKWAILGFANRTQTRVNPTLAQLDPAYAKKALALLDDPTANALFAKGECLVALRRQEEGIAAWQQILDRFPTGPHFAMTEQRIKEVLGISKAQQALEAAVAACAGVSAALLAAAPELERSAGLEALAPKLAGLARSCPARGQAGASEEGLVWLQAATRAGAAGECGLFKAWSKRASSLMPSLPATAIQPGACAGQ